MQENIVVFHLDILKIHCTVQQALIDSQRADCGLIAQLLKKALLALDIIGDRITVIQIINKLNYFHLVSFPCSAPFVLYCAIAASSIRCCSSSSPIIALRLLISSSCLSSKSIT